MLDMSLFLIAFFLPLFPFSLLFNAIYAAIPNPLIRSVLLVGWPILGSYLVGWLEVQIPDWAIAWAIATSAFYAFRLLAMREMGIWIGFLATSAWALLWLPLAQQQQQYEVFWYAMSFNIPLALLAVLAASLVKNFGAAYTGLYGGLAQSVPRFSGLLVLTVLAATATPIFPSFFVMLQQLVIAQPMVAISLASIWLLWSWASVRLLQGLIVGDATQEVNDTSMPATVLYALVLLALCVAGVKLIGGL